MLFDSRLELGIKLPSPDGVKRVFVSIPSDTNWETWRRKKRITQRDLGRRSFQIEASKPEPCDLDLFKKALVAEQEDGYTLPADPADAAADAAFVIGLLTTVEATGRPSREGSLFRIELKVMGRHSTVHVLRMPSMREMLEYERVRSSITFGQYGTQEIRVNYRAAAELYDKLVKREQLEGYAEGSPIPVIHKAEAVNVLLQEIRAEQDEDGADDDDEG
jgi:hypothetical protein